MPRSEGHPLCRDRGPATTSSAMPRGWSDGPERWPVSQGHLLPSSLDFSPFHGGGENALSRSGQFLCAIVLREIRLSRDIRLAHRDQADSINPSSPAAMSPLVSRVRRTAAIIMPWASPRRRSLSPSSASPRPVMTARRATPRSMQQADCVPREGVNEGGGMPRRFNTITVTDGIAMGHQGMKSSLVSREVIADSVELSVRGHCYDALVTFAGCDKSLPGMMMAMLAAQRAVDLRLWRLDPAGPVSGHAT